MAIQYNLIGAITPNSATITSKFDYPAPTPNSTELKILRIRYHSTLGMQVYVNGKLEGTDNSKTGNFAYIENLMIGSDADEVAYFKGYICELAFINDFGTPNTATNNNIIAQERWLADKWLATGTVLDDGYVVKASESGSFPMIPMPDRIQWLQMNETTIVNNGSGKCSKWDDFVGFGGVLKHGVPTTGSLPATIAVNKFKGKNALYFDGTNNYKVSGLKQTGDPDFFTFFMVFAFDDTTGDQTVIGAIDDGGTVYNNAIRIKKYSGESNLAVRINTAGFNEVQVPFSDVYSISYPPNTVLGNTRLKYSKNPSFTDANYTALLPHNSANNGVTKHKLTGLSSNTQYYVKMETDGVEQPEILKFKTFPLVGTPTNFKFVAGSCNYTGSNAETFEEIKNEEPLFWSHLGDWHYEDITTNDSQLFRNAYNTTAKQTRVRDLNRNVPLMYIFDDHDFGDNNSDKNSPSKVASINFYQENIPHYSFLNDANSNPLTDSLGQSWIVGRVLFIMTDLRSQRDNFLIDDYDPNKKMLGDVQKAWFKSTLLSAKNNDDIALICWLNPGSWTGEDLDGYSWDYGSSGEHWTAYKAERTELWQWMNTNNITNMFIVNGDTHQQAIDDGRNAIFDTTSPTLLDWKTFPENRLTPCIEASPFHKDVDRGSGPFQINDIGDSGSVAVLSEKTYTTFEIEDNGTEWIKVIVKQYALPDGLVYYTEKTLVNKFEFVRPCKGAKAPKPEVNNESGVQKLAGKIKTNLTLNKKSAAITFISPTSFQNNWKAPIIGKVNGTKTNRIVKVYRRSDEDYLVGECAVNATTGEFTFTGNKGISTLVFKIYNSTTNTLIEEVINDGVNGETYSDIEAKLYITSDIDYYQRATSIGVTSGYSFEVSTTDEDKIYKVKIINKSTNEVLAETPVKGWLPRSYTLEKDDPAYITPFASKSYLYDAGLSLISLAGVGNSEGAKRTAKGIVKSQLVNGAFPFSTNHINPIGADAYLRSGAICWVAYALGYYLEMYPNSAIKEDVKQCLIKALEYLKTLQDNTKGGLIKGGSGRYTTSGGIETFDPNYIIPWVSTEHNIDAYFAFKQAGNVLANVGYTSIATTIGNSIVARLYNSTENRMYQGINADGTPDTADALDINSWGAIAMVALGQREYAVKLLERAERYYSSVNEETGALGYKPYSSELGYPNAKDTVWFEGSFGVALAYYKIGNVEKYNQLLDGLYKFKESDGAFRYATLRDATYEITNNKAIASTAWFVLANSLANNVWK